MSRRQGLELSHLYAYEISILFIDLKDYENHSEVPHCHFLECLKMSRSIIEM